MLGFERQRGREVILQYLRKRVDVPQRRPEVVGDGVGERLQFLVGRGQLRRALLHTLLELGVQLPDLIFRALAFGDVAQDNRVNLLPLDLDMGDRGLDGKFLPVRAQTGERPQIAHRPAGDAGVAKLGHVPAMRLAEARRDEPVERLPQRFPGRAAEHLLRRLVEDRDALPGINADDRVHGRPDDAGEPRAAFPRLPLRALAFGDVARDGGDADDVAARIPDRGHGERNLDGSAVLADAHGFVVADSALPDLLENVRFLLRPVRGLEAGNGLAEHLRRRVAEHPLRAGVPTDHFAVQVLPDDGIVGGFHDGRQEGADFLVLAQRLRLRLDAREHPVEGVGQQTRFVPADLLRANGIIAALGNRFGHLRQREDRAGDPPLQSVGNDQRHQH